MAISATSISSNDDSEQVLQLAQLYSSVRSEIAKRVIGQNEVVEHLLITLFSGGHGLFVGVPGLAKTLLINTLAESMELEFNRVQFTPDLMPSDITGTEIIEQDELGKRHFRFVKGPIFCNILLADEINRTPPKTQAALLQSMQEKQITASGHTYPLAPPFHVFATQNPIEQEGTYPLPEAQLDRFMMMLHVDYPTEAEEMEVVRSTTGVTPAAVDRIVSPEQLLKFQELVLRVPVADPLVAKAVHLVRQTRPGKECVSEDVKQYVSYGAGPRATQHLILASKARAILNGRSAVDIEDIRTLAQPVLRHRIITNFNAEARKVTADQLVETLLRTFVL